MSSPVLHARGLTKLYGERRVVDGLDLDCSQGTVLGLLGPNGAGKTTTLRMLYGFVDPDGGSITYDGKNFEDHRSEAKRFIGVCTQDDTLDYDLTVAQNLEVYASYFRPRVESLERRVEELLVRFGLHGYAAASPHVLSGGFIRRLLIARSIVHEPRVLFLDEPTTGLDPSARLDVWELIHGMRAEGLGIILTTHYMDEAERLSDALLVLKEGKDVARGVPREVIGRLLGDYVLVIPPEETQSDAIEQWLLEQGETRLTRVLGELRVPVTKNELGALSERYPNAKWEVRQPTLDDLFIALARGGRAR